MKKYICPMHLEVESTRQSKCPKCGMDLVLKADLVHETTMYHGAGVNLKNYLPLFVIIGLILLSSIAISIRDLQLGGWNLSQSVSYFMIGFFLVFSGFKLIDLKGFAQGYSTYDLLAKKWFGYGYIYPFIELAFGLSMILIPHSVALMILEILVMGFSGIGVAIKIAKKEKFQCACLGTFLKVPLTKVTLIEDFGMATLAFMLLILK